MNFIRRLGYYLGGFAIGLIFLLYFLNGKKTQCNYGPEARVLNNLSKKEWVLSNHIKPEWSLDSVTLLSLMKYAKIDFSKSDVKRDSCKIYAINTKVKNQPYLLKVENCSKTARIINLERAKE